MSAALCGLSVGLGALFPNFKEDNPSKIVSGFGGTLCLVASFVYIVLFITLLAFPASLPFTLAAACRRRRGRRSCIRSRPRRWRSALSAAAVGAAAGLGATALEKHGILSRVCIATSYGRTLWQNVPAAPSTPPRRRRGRGDVARAAGPPARAAGSERIDSQVQKAQEQLLKLKREQERSKNRSANSKNSAAARTNSKQGRAEMVEKLTRALVVLERQTAEAQKRVEQLARHEESFASHLHALEASTRRAGPSADLQRELSRALGMVDHARTEFNQQEARFASEAAEGGESGGVGGRRELRRDVRRREPTIRSCIG